MEQFMTRDQDMIISSYSTEQLKTFLSSSSPYYSTLSFPMADVRANPVPEVSLEKQYRLFYPALLPKSLNTDLQEDNTEKYVFGVFFFYSDMTDRIRPILLRALLYFRRQPWRSYPDILLVSIITLNPLPPPLFQPRPFKSCFHHFLWSKIKW